jgi:phage/plasmid primase-like uncharacterized protein
VSVATQYKRCPGCGKKGWFKDREGIRRCRYCSHSDAIKVVSERLRRTLERGQQGIDRALSKGRRK